MVKKKEPYKKLNIDFEIPEELSDTIDKFLDYLNRGEYTMDDCFQEEIRVILNWCKRENILTEDQIELLRNYYQRGGIRKYGQVN